MTDKTGIHDIELFDPEWIRDHMDPEFFGEDSDTGDDRVDQITDTLLVGINDVAVEVAESEDELYIVEILGAIESMVPLIKGAIHEAGRREGVDTPFEPLPVEALKASGGIPEDADVTVIGGDDARKLLGKVLGESTDDDDEDDATDDRMYQ